MSEPRTNFGGAWSSWLLDNPGPAQSVNDHDERQINRGFRVLLRRKK